MQTFRKLPNVKPAITAAVISAQTGMEESHSERRLHGNRSEESRGYPHRKRCHYPLDSSLRSD